MSKIKNKGELLSHAFSQMSFRAREIALEVIEKALEAVDPKKIIESRVNLKNNILNINGKTFDLKNFKRIYVIGGGKASGSMAEALEKILGNRIEAGFVVVPHGTASEYQTKRIKLHEAGHPVPDESSVEGSKKLLSLAGCAEREDLVICLVSGGGSSLMSLPRDGISLVDKQKTTELLLKSGATINEMNTVRKHISGFKGGQLAEKAYPATIISLLLSDVVGDPLDVIASGPTVPDSTTFRDAVYVLKKYDLWHKIPESVRKVISDGEKGLIQETPKRDNPVFDKVHNMVIGNNRLACLSAMDELKKLGLTALFLSSFVEGEAKNVGLILSALAKEIVTSSNPSPPPLGVVIGGETTVTVTGKGKGGRNQEIALAAALQIKGIEKVVIASVSTDGIDGPTDAAGAIVDGGSIFRSEDMKLDARDYLKNNDSYSFFSKIGDLIYTGPTGTNVNDLSILIVL
ncbi:MAG: glycerate kinase [Candidatus Bathyarchaeia archaeon]